MSQIVTQGYSSFPWVREELEYLFDAIGGAYAEAPASSSLSKHHCYRGGLLYHMWEVFTLKILMMKGLGLIRQDFTEQAKGLILAQCLLVAYIHDLHKATDFFGVDYYVPNILKSGQQSDRKPFEINEAYLDGEMMVPPESMSTWTCIQKLLHREKKSISGGSVSLAWIEGKAPRLLSLLSEDMRQAIVYHDGGYGRAKYELSGAESSMTILTHAADMLSSRLEMALVSVEPLDTLVERLGL